MFGENSKFDNITHLMGHWPFVKLLTGRRNIDPADRFKVFVSLLCHWIKTRQDASKAYIQEVEVEEEGRYQGRSGQKGIKLKGERF